MSNSLSRFLKVQISSSNAAVLTFTNHPLMTHEWKVESDKQKRSFNEARVAVGHKVGGTVPQAGRNAKAVIKITETFITRETLCSMTGLVMLQNALFLYQHQLVVNKKMCGLLPYFDFLVCEHQNVTSHSWCIQSGTFILHHTACGQCQCLSDTICTYSLFRCLALLTFSFHSVIVLFLLFLLLQNYEVHMFHQIVLVLRLL